MAAVALTARHEMILLAQADADKEVTATEAIVIATHRTGCAQCQAAYRIVRAAQAAVQTFGTRHVMPADGRQALIARVGASRDKSSSK